MELKQQKGGSRPFWTSSVRLLKISAAELIDA